MGHRHREALERLAVAHKASPLVSLVDCGQQLAAKVPHDAACRVCTEVTRTVEKANCRNCSTAAEGLGAEVACEKGIGAAELLRKETS